MKVGRDNKISLVIAEVLCYDERKNKEGMQDGRKKLFGKIKKMYHMKIAIIYSKFC